MGQSQEGGMGEGRKESMGVGAGIGGTDERGVWLGGVREIVDGGCELRLCRLWGGVKD